MQMWVTVDSTLEHWQPAKTALNDPCSLVPKYLNLNGSCSAGDNYAWLGEDGTTVYSLGGGTNKNGGLQAMVWKSTSVDLIQWEFDALLYNETVPKGTDVGELNCPDFFEISPGKWVLIYLTHPPWHLPWITVWRLGTLEKNGTFTTTSKGLADQSSGFIAAQSAWVPSLLVSVLQSQRQSKEGSRRVQYSWVETGITGVAAGAQTLPRQIQLTADGQALTFAPVKEVGLLRDAQTHKLYSGVLGADRSDIFLMSGLSLQLDTTFFLGNPINYETGTWFGVSVLNGAVVARVEKAAGENWVLNVINFTVAGNHSDLRVLPRADGSVTLSIYVDRTLVEVFLNDLRGEGATVTTCSVCYLNETDTSVELVSSTGGREKGLVAGKRSVVWKAESWEMLSATPWAPPS